MTKIYTKSGDNGTTGLISGGRVPKDSLRVEAYGSVDELNSLIGVALSHGVHADVHSFLTDVQHDLFEMGSDLASPKTKEEPFPIPRIAEERVTFLEMEIDRITSLLPPLQQFILPGGSKSAAALHHARTVCRRTERRVVTLSHHEAVNPFVMLYLNRLSDLLFTLARYQNLNDEFPETVWTSSRSQSESA